MTIEIHQLVIRAVVSAPPAPATPVDDPEIVTRCVRAVLRQLDRNKER
ncbi:MAG: DUF5908 family protein [Cyanobacteriota bacterium]|nr:DUF5908 family protein [Cyanobacteriota bacterium]